MTDAEFAARLGAARDRDAVYAALHARSQVVTPVRLWTVMDVDMEAGVARRAYTSHPGAYPVSGTKPVPQNDWFDRIATAHEPFVANDIAAIAAVFPDHETIAALGCASVVNLPVVLAGRLAATVNLLDAAGAFPVAVVDRLREALALPAVAAVGIARTL